MQKEAFSALTSAANTKVSCLGRRRHQYLNVASLILYTYLCYITPYASHDT